MLNLFYDFIPVILFFVVFKLYGIYAATIAGIIATAIQVVITSIIKRRVDKQQLITLIVFVIFGGMTLYFHNPLFVKWKPTVIYWIFSLVLFFSHFIGKKPLMQRMMEKVVEDDSLISKTIWTRINIAWTVFFLLLGFVNLGVAYTFSTDTWVNFKVYGTLGLLFLFSFLQAAYLAKYIPEKK